MCRLSVDTMFSCLKIRVPGIYIDLYIKARPEGEEGQHLLCDHGLPIISWKAKKEIRP